MKDVGKVSLAVSSPLGPLRRDRVNARPGEHLVLMSLHVHLQLEMGGQGLVAIGAHKPAGRATLWAASGCGRICHSSAEPATSATGTSCRVLRNLAVAVAVHLLKGSVFGAAVPILDAVTV